jgi:hypothetical protein
MGAINKTVVGDWDWVAAGEELRRVDPVRYVELLQLAMQIVKIHTDPDSPDDEPDIVPPAWRRVGDDWSA